MRNLSQSLPEHYWEETEIQDSDLEFLYNHLLDLEMPQTSAELTQALISERIEIEKKNLQNQQKDAGDVYLPKETYKVGQKLVFPALNWEKGKVNSVRDGVNPDLPPFKVIDVALETGEVKSFAAGLEDHLLNNPIQLDDNDPLLNASQVNQTFGKGISSKLTKSLEANPDLVLIAGSWFPRSLLVDVNIGHLNLAEAILEEAEGGPLSTTAIMSQVELPANVNSKLKEFSMNLALQEDDRFDEVGPAGVTLWFLKRLEPTDVQNIPDLLKYKPIDYDAERVKPLTDQLETQFYDELECKEDDGQEINDITVSLIYPHWRAGTLPLTCSLARLFPTAYEAPRVQFNFIDSESGETFSGWVVRPQRYIYGLKAWFDAQSLMPGSMIHLQRGEKPGEIILKVEKRRQNREWIRTVLIGTDGGIVYAMLKQLVTAAFDERMAIAIPDVAAVDQIWKLGKAQRTPLEQIVHTTMVELAKLNPQGQVHAQELYASINIVRRCPPGPILNVLTNSNEYSHLGDLYFRVNESLQEDETNAGRN
jgi:hypothetical protein